MWIEVKSLLIGCYIISNVNSAYRKVSIFYLDIVGFKVVEGVVKEDQLIIISFNEKETAYDSNLWSLV